MPYPKCHTPAPLMPARDGDVSSVRCEATPSTRCIDEIVAVVVSKV
jgi:hypothetical protein